MHRRFWQALALGALLATGSCQRDSAPAALRGGASKPAQAVRLLTGHLLDNDLAAFARDAVPPELHAQLETAWRQGRTRWPLDELPFAEHAPAILAALAAPGSETTLQLDFDRQFSGADAELKTAAASLGSFGAQYIRSEGEFSDSERAHYAQVIDAVSDWGMAAPLGDPRRARTALARLAKAARKTGLTSEADFAEAGMQRSLEKLSPFVFATKRVLATYGLDLDDSLGAMQASLQQQTGDHASVRMQYTLGGQAIDAVVEVERHDGRWYLSDYLRHAEAAVAMHPAAPKRP